MSNAERSPLFSKIPSVDEVVRDITPELTRVYGSFAVTNAAREVLNKLRLNLSSGKTDTEALTLMLDGLTGAVEKELLDSFSPSLRPVINATGVILHTNLGRAPLAASAMERIQETASVYCNLEFDLKSGERGNRDVHVDRLFDQILNGISDRNKKLSTIVVNNNAAAVLLALNSLAEGGEVIVSRGELVEIGGSFRIPEIMAKSGATLREVGTTNRTRIADYERAINDRTRLLLRVHRSNFEITGFTEDSSTAELVALAHQHGLPVMDDLGSGAIVDLRLFGIHGEPSVLDSIRRGVDVVAFSGDKLLGGPQSGLLTGRADLISGMRSNSLFRALRVDKLSYAALEATLLAYMRRDFDSIPTLHMMSLPTEEIGKRARALAAEIESDFTIEVIEGESVIGGGAAPSSVLPTLLLALSRNDLSPDEIVKHLRGNTPPVIARVEEGRVLLDLRTVFPAQDSALASALNRIRA